MRIGGNIWRKVRAIRYITVIRCLLKSQAYKKLLKFGSVKIVKSYL